MLSMGEMVPLLLHLKVPHLRPHRRLYRLICRTRQRPQVMHHQVHHDRAVISLLAQLGGQAAHPEQKQQQRKHQQWLHRVQQRMWPLRDWLHPRSCPAACCVRYWQLC